MSVCRALFKDIPGGMWPAGRRLDRLEMQGLGRDLHTSDLEVSRSVATRGTQKHGVQGTEP